MNVMTEQRAPHVGDVLNPSPDLPPGSIVQRIDLDRMVKHGVIYVPGVFVRAYNDTSGDPWYDLADGCWTWAEVLAGGPVTIVYIPGQDAPAEPDPASSIRVGQDRAVEWLADHDQRDAAGALNLAIITAPDGLL